MQCLYMYFMNRTFQPNDNKGYKLKVVILLNWFKYKKTSVSCTTMRHNRALWVAMVLLGLAAAAFHVCILWTQSHTGSFHSGGWEGIWSHQWCSVGTVPLVPQVARAGCHPHSDLSSDGILGSCMCAGNTRKQGMRVFKHTLWYSCTTIIIHRNSWYLHRQPRSQIYQS